VDVCILLIARWSSPAGGAYPIYLQHEGHSRTVVGAAQNKRSGAIFLVVLDPDCMGGGPKLLSDVQAGNIKRVRGFDLPFVWMLVTCLLSDNRVCRCCEA